MVLRTGSFGAGRRVVSSVSGSAKNVLGCDKAHGGRATQIIG